jgi:hypothetical protein
MPPSPTRVVLLGASNLTMGLRTVLGLARAWVPPGPVAAFVAAGHGRSYGQWSRVGGRGLPGILDCGLWPALAAAPAGATYALVTDIGNDVAYGVSPATLAAWVRACVDRLDGATIVLTPLPAASLARLPQWRYHLAKAVLFPGRRLPYADLHAQVAEVNARLAECAARPGGALVEPRPEWYGADGIHLRLRRRSPAWAEVLLPWLAPERGPVPPGAPARWAGRRPAPAYRTLLGIGARREQPSARLADGTPVSLY